MRELILKRIEEIRNKEQGFPTSVTRWRNFTHGTENKHLKDINFEELPEHELLSLFERLIRRYYTQM
jgi:hypothetical protein